MGIEEATVCKSEPSAEEWEKRDSEGLDGVDGLEVGGEYGEGEAEDEGEEMIGMKDGSLATGEHGTEDEGEGMVGVKEGSSAAYDT